jgi:hypothetical protein
MIWLNVGQYEATLRIDVFGKGSLYHIQILFFGDFQRFNGVFKDFFEVLFYLCFVSFLFPHVNRKSRSGTCSLQGDQLK